MDIREYLQKVEGSGPVVDRMLVEALDVADRNLIFELHRGMKPFKRNELELSTNIQLVLTFLGAKECDWILASVNGHVGGTPWGCVGVSEEDASYAATPLLSLWLSYFRLILGDERWHDVGGGYVCNCASWCPEDCLLKKMGRCHAKLKGGPPVLGEVE